MSKVNNFRCILDLCSARNSGACAELSKLIGTPGKDFALLGQSECMQTAGRYRDDSLINQAINKLGRAFTFRIVAESQLATSIRTHRITKQRRYTNCEAKHELTCEECGVVGATCNGDYCDIVAAKFGDDVRLGLWGRFLLV